jgi:hypothetical protein
MNTDLNYLCGARAGMFGGTATDLQKAARNTVPLLQRAGFLYVDGAGNTDHVAIMEPFAGDGKKISNGLVLCFAGDGSNDAIAWRQAIEGKGISLVTGLSTVDEALEVVAQCYGERAKSALEKRAADLAPTPEVKPTIKVGWR